MKCPRCDIETKNIGFEHIEFDICEKCHGIWFDKEELEKTFKIGSELTARIIKVDPSERKIALSIKTNGEV